MEDMTFAVTFGNKPAPWATLASVPGVNINHGNATFSSLILDELAKLSKSPGMLDVALLFGDPGSFPDIPKVLHDNYIPGLARVDNDLGDPVVEVGHPAALLPTQPLQGALGTFCALGLERLPQPRVMCADVHRLFA